MSKRYLIFWLEMIQSIFFWTLVPKNVQLSMVIGKLEHITMCSSKKRKENEEEKEARITSTARELDRGNFNWDPFFGWSSDVRESWYLRRKIDEEKHIQANILRLMSRIKNRIQFTLLKRSVGGFCWILLSVWKLNSYIELKHFTIL